MKGVATLKVKLPPARSTLPVLATVRVCKLLVVPVAQLPNASAPELTSAADLAATALPLIVTGELLTPVIVIVPRLRVPPLSTTVGAEVYPLPPLRTVIELTAPAVRLAIAAAPTPPPPMRRTVGGDVYRVPPVPTLIVLTLPVVRMTVAVAVGVVGTGVQRSLIVHDDPGVSGSRPQLPRNPVTRTNGPTIVGAAGTVKLVVPLLDTVKSRVGAVAVPEPATTSVNDSGAGLATISVLPATTWNSTAPTSAGFAPLLARGLPKKSLDVVAGSGSPLKRRQAPALIARGLPFEQMFVPRFTAADVPRIE